jgi:gliding motility-associated-like protein
MKYLYTFILAFVTSATAFSQTTACPQVVAGPDTSLCGSAGCVNLFANIQGTAATTTYNVVSIPYNPFPGEGSNPVLVNIDDIWSTVIPLPFCFEYFGQTYNSLVIGSNAIITFDLAQANQYCQWPITAAIPSNTNPMNSIMAPWHDIDPSVNNTAADITWEVYGTAPCRQMVISWDSIAMFSCTSILSSSQLVLHETTNIIDVYMRDKPLCVGWNAGAAILGIQDATGSTAFVASTYNYPTQWTALNEGWRFEPAGAPQYVFAWTDMSGNPLSSQTNYQVCPTVTTSYLATVVNQTCNGPLTFVDTVTIGVSSSTLSVATSGTPDICNSGVGTTTATPTGQGPFTYVWQPGGQTTQTATGLNAGTYSVIVIDAAGCSTSETITIVNTNPPINPTLTTNAIGGLVNQTTPGSPVQVCFSTTGPGTITSWNWLYDGTQTSNIQSPCFTESDSGLFCARVVVTDSFGCVDTADICLRVVSEAIFTFPNVFTPNADGSNDLFLPTMVGVKDLKCTIYDRWGVEMYTWIDLAGGWNGKVKNNGAVATDGVYYWEAIVTDFQGKSENVSGFVHLIRN